MKPVKNIWIQREQCPCGDWKCFIKYEAEEQGQACQPTKDGASSSSSKVIFTPYVGQVFRSDDEAFEYYSKFARKNGFSIRKARSTESHNLGVYRRDFVCYRSGFNQPRKKADVEHPRDRKSVRCGCDAKFYLTKEIVNGVTQWFVFQFSNIHNHELLEDDQVRLLPAYRKIQEADQERILLLSKAGFPVNRIVKILELEKGVQSGQLPFIERDIRNFVRTCKKTVQENYALLTEKRVNDVMELLEGCKAMSERDGVFAFDCLTDANGKVENIAWSYGESVHAYNLFGDAVQFDITYQSVTYGILLGLFSRIDNHGRPIFFACVLLQEENSHAFLWALQIGANLGYGTKENIQYIHLKTQMSVEEYSQSILTPYAFSLFQQELVLSVQYAVIEMAKGSYVVRHYKKIERECILIWIPEDEQIQCSCKGFEHSGILCRHALRLFTMNYFQLPDKFFPCRWRLESSISPSNQENIHTSKENQGHALHSLCDTLVTESLLSKERYIYAHKELTTLLDHVKKYACRCSCSRYLKNQLTLLCQKCLEFRV